MPHALTNQDRNGPAFRQGYDAAMRGLDNYRNPCRGNATGEHNYYAGYMAGMTTWEKLNNAVHPGR